MVVCLEMAGHFRDRYLSVYSMVLPDDLLPAASHGNKKSSPDKSDEL